MRARAQSLPPALPLSLTRAPENAHAQRKRCTADQTDVTPLPAHSALFGENKAPVRSESEIPTRPLCKKKQQRSKIGFTRGLRNCEQHQMCLETDPKNLLCPCFAPLPLLLGDGNVLGFVV